MCNLYFVIDTLRGNQVEWTPHTFRYIEQLALRRQASQPYHFSFLWATSCSPCSSRSEYPLSSPFIVPDKYRRRTSVLDRSSRSESVDDPLASLLGRMSTSNTCWPEGYALVQDPDHQTFRPLLSLYRTIQCRRVGILWIVTRRHDLETGENVTRTTIFALKMKCTTPSFLLPFARLQLTKDSIYRELEEALRPPFRERSVKTLFTLKIGSKLAAPRPINAVSRVSARARSRIIIAHYLSDLAHSRPSSEVRSALERASRSSELCLVREDRQYPPDDLRAGIRENAD